MGSQCSSTLDFDSPPPSRASSRSIEEILEDGPTQLTATLKECYARLQDESTYNDGTVTLVQLGEFLAQLGASEREQREAMLQAQSQYPGRLDEESFIALVFEYQQNDLLGDVELEEAFRGFSLDEGGCLSALQMKEFMMEFGENEKVTDQEVNEIFLEADQDGDGLLSLEEFKAFMKICSFAHSEKKTSLCKQAMLDLDIDDIRRSIEAEQEAASITRHPQLQSSRVLARDRGVQPKVEAESVLTQKTTRPTGLIALSATTRGHSI